MDSNPDAALTITSYENSPSFVPPTKWCPPGITSSDIEAMMRKPHIEGREVEIKQDGKKKWVKVTQYDPLDEEVRVLKWKAMQRGCERRRVIVEREVQEDLRRMGLLGWDGMVVPPFGDDRVVGSEQSDPPDEGLWSSSSSSSSLSSTASGDLNRGTPPTPWREVDEREEDAGGSQGKSKRALEERDDENEVTTRKANGAISSQQGRRGRAYDQDEMVRNEQAFLPEKRLRKHRLLFEEDAGAQPQWGKDQQTRTKSNIGRSRTPALQSHLGKRKRGGPLIE
jgi:hypothetical protein